MIELAYSHSYSPAVAVGYEYMKLTQCIVFELCIRSLRDIMASVVSDLRPGTSRVHCETNSQLLPSVLHIACPTITRVDTDERFAVRCGMH